MAKLLRINSIFRIDVDIVTPDFIAAMKVAFQEKPRVVEVQPGRNDPCDCSSGKKYKKCCGR